VTVALPPPRVTERLSSYSDSSRSSESLAHCPQIVIQETRRGENHVVRHNSRPPANVRSELSERIIVPSFGPAQTFSKLFRAAEPKIPQNSVMRRVHIDGAGHRVADEKQRNPVPQSELCGWGLPSLIPNACDRRDGSGYSQQEISSSSIIDDAAADNRFLRKRPPCLPAHQKYSKQRQAERDRNQCKHKSTRSSIASNHPAGMMRTGNTAFMRIESDWLGLLQCAMANITSVLNQLQQERSRLTHQIDRLNRAISALKGTSNSRTGRTLSAAGRARIAAAQRARWAKVRGQKVVSINGRRRRKISAAALANIRAAQKARWAKWRKQRKAT
jgi:hypothetical protein